MVLRRNEYRLRALGVIEATATVNGIEVEMLLFGTRMPEVLEGVPVVLLDEVCGCEACQKVQAGFARHLLSATERCN